tara:strand:+ start:632 stop:1198 length:567 start_codon:yes stop_codon:yes gene_type:complete
MNQNMNALVFDEDCNLWVKKPDGLEYTFENVDPPALGFEYEMVVYDQEESKVVKWNKDLPFDQQERVPLTEAEKEMCEQYIANSEPPEGVTLQRQHVNRLEEVVDTMVTEMSNNYGFSEFMAAVYAGREGSNHPHRSSARRVLEFADAQHVILSDISNEIYSTREDFLASFEEYATKLPTPPALPDHP